MKNVLISAVVSFVVSVTTVGVMIPWMVDKAVTKTVNVGVGIVKDNAGVIKNVAKDKISDYCETHNCPWKK